MIIIVVCLALCAPVAWADQWATPTRQVIVSPNGKLQAVITPAKHGKSAASVSVGPKGVGKAFTLVEPATPVASVLFDDGTLLTFDNWHQLGFGKVATLYERTGKVRWTKTLDELVGQQMAESATRSVSSVWWRRVPLEWSLARDGKSGLVTLFDENQVKIDLADGASTLVAVTTLPDDPERLLNRARALAQRGQDVAALAALERAIAKDPDQFEALGLYVDILQRTSDHARAVAMLERVSPRWKTKDGYGVANVSIAWAKSLTALSKASEAERVLRLGVAAAPTYVNPAIALATLLVEQKRPKDADVVVDEFVARLFKVPYLDTFALANIADFYKVRHEYRKALALYLKGYKADQVTNQFLYAELAELYEEMGNDADAIRINEQLLAYFQKMGSAFDSYTKTTREALVRLRAKKPKP